MNCCIEGCENRASHFYNIRKARFGYCDKHKDIPEKVIVKAKYVPIWTMHWR